MNTRRPRMQLTADDDYGGKSGIWQKRQCPAYHLRSGKPGMGTYRFRFRAIVRTNKIGVADIQDSRFSPYGNRKPPVQAMGKPDRYHPAAGRDFFLDPLPCQMYGYRRYNPFCRIGVDQPAGQKFCTVRGDGMNPPGIELFADKRIAVHDDKIRASVVLANPLHRPSAEVSGPITHIRSIFPASTVSVMTPAGLFFVRPILSRPMASGMKRSWKCSGSIIPLF